MTTLEIEVTRGDIAEGRIGDFCRCPVARAIGRAAGRRAIVGAMCWGLHGLAPLYPLPRAVSEWIADYDAGMAVGPIRFALEMPACPEPVAAR